MVFIKNIFEHFFHNDPKHDSRERLLKLAKLKKQVFFGTQSFLLLTSTLAAYVIKIFDKKPVYLQVKIYSIYIFFEKVIIYFFWKIKLVFDSGPKIVPMII